MTLRCNNAALTATAARGKPKMAASYGNEKAILEKKREQNSNGNGAMAEEEGPGPLSQAESLIM